MEGLESEHLQLEAQMKNTLEELEQLRSVAKEREELGQQLTYVSYFIAHLSKN